MSFRSFVNLTATAVISAAAQTYITGWLKECTTKRKEKDHGEQQQINRKRSLSVKWDCAFDTKVRFSAHTIQWSTQ